MAEILNNENFEEKLNDNEILVVDFYAQWCGPCKVLLPIIEELSDEKNEEGKVAITKVNVDESSEIAVKYGVRSIPTLIFFKNGEEVKRMTGLQPKTVIEAEIDSLK